MERKSLADGSSSPVEDRSFPVILISFPPYSMDHFHRITAALAAGAISLVIPVSSLAFGLGFGVQSQSRTEVSEDSAETSADADADFNAKVLNRCKHLGDDDRTLCEKSVHAQFEARGDADARVNVRAIHGKMMSNVRHRMQDVREDGRDIFARARAFLSGFMAQLRTALKTEAELALKVCKDKEGDEQKTCVADAKVKLQAKVNAAIEAMKK